MQRFAIIWASLALRAALFMTFVFSARAEEAASDLSRRLVYVQTNLLVDKNVENAIGVLERAAKAGYNGVVIADSKFMRWDNLPERYAVNARKVRDACRRLKLAFLPCVFPIGYSNDLLSRDPNLAEGLPVVDAPFVVRGGRIGPAEDSTTIANGGFEQYKGNTPAGWQFVDQPGKISFIDTQVKCEGAASLRMQNVGANDPKNGHGRTHQRIKVRPFTNYHVSVAVKTQDFEAADEVRIQMLAEGGRSLNYLNAGIKKTQDWRRVDVCFNSLESSEVNFYLGVWGGKGGTIWWDDVRIEPAGLVNVIRRDGAPLRVTSEDGKSVYREGKDFDGARDPKMGVAPWPGGYSVWHEQPVVTVPNGSALKEGQRVLMSYYHPALIYDGAVVCCMSEPKVYEILSWQADQMKKRLEPDGYFMSHDEIRAQGWDESCAKRKMTPGQILADNVRRCVDILRKTDPGKPVYVWSDMFDAYHNAGKTGPYYLVKGDGPWVGSWEGLPKDVIVANWNMQKDKRVDSLKHFDGLGNRQILAGYYDADPARMTDWLRDAAGIRGLDGVMYTTWQQKYGDLERFASVCWEKQSEKTGR